MSHSRTARHCRPATCRSSEQQQLATQCDDGSSCQLANFVSLVGDHKLLYTSRPSYDTFQRPGFRPIHEKESAEHVDGAIYVQNITHILATEQVSMNLDYNEACTGALVERGRSPFRQIFLSRNPERRSGKCLSQPERGYCSRAAFWQIQVTLCTKIGQLILVKSLKLLPPDFRF